MTLEDAISGLRGDTKFYHFLKMVRDLREGAIKELQGNCAERREKYLAGQIAAFDEVFEAGGGQDALDRLKGL